MSNNKKILAAILKHRLEICTPNQDANDTGGFDISYTTIATIWGGVSELSDWSQYVRGQHIGIRDTHEFIVRFSAIKNLGKAYASAFANSFYSIGNLIPLKTQWFIKLNNTNTKKRLFQITGVKRDDNCKAWMKIRAIEIEEQGTGWPI